MFKQAYLSLLTFSYNFMKYDMFLQNTTRSKNTFFVEYDWQKVKYAYICLAHAESAGKTQLTLQMSSLQIVFAEIAQATMHSCDVTLQAL